MYTKGDLEESSTPVPAHPLPHWDSASLVTAVQEFGMS